MVVTSSMKKPFESKPFSSTSSEGFFFRFSNCEIFNFWKILCVFVCVCIYISVYFLWKFVDGISALGLGIMRRSRTTRRRLRRWEGASRARCSSTSRTWCSSIIFSRKPFPTSTWGSSRIWRTLASGLWWSRGRLSSPTITLTRISTLPSSTSQLLRGIISFKKNLNV